MDSATTIIFSIQGLIWGSGFILLVYLAFRRLRIKETENFEDRSN